MQDAPHIADAKLPEDLAVCQAMIRELLTALAQSRRSNEQLEHRLDRLLKQLYGPRADRIHPHQLLLFAPPAPPEPTPEPEPVVDVKPPTAKKKGHGRKGLPENLRRETVVIDIPEAEKIAFGGVWTKIGEEVSERLDYTPSGLFVKRTVRPKYVVRRDSQPEAMRIAELPAEALPKSKAAPGLVADVIVSKCVDHLPLYRQEKRYARQGVAMARSTLCDWLAEAALAMMPLYHLLKRRVLTSKVVHTDDTPIPVQDGARDRCRTGRIWTYVTRDAIVYDATPDRCRDGPAAFLAGFVGFLQCDAYAGYDSLFADGTIVEVACWAHARRKFVEAAKTSPAIAAEAVTRIKQLYAVEDETRDLDRDSRLSLRQEKSKPLLDAFGAWLDRVRFEALPKSPIGEAIAYATNQWKALNVYVTDGDLSIDNNAAERAIKPYAIGRKNWLFFGSDNGGRTLAILSSFTATCGLVKINVWDYLKDVLTRLPATPADQLASLLPHAWATSRAA